MLWYTPIPSPIPVYNFTSSWLKAAKASCWPFPNPLGFWKKVLSNPQQTCPGVLYYKFVIGAGRAHVQYDGIDFQREKIINCTGETESRFVRSR